MKSLAAIALILFAAAVAGCSRQAASAAPQQALPSHAPATSAPSQAGQTATGTVLETMDAASYTYVRVKTATGEIWAAAAQFKVGAGDRVVVPLEMPVKNFHSPSLNRDFPLLYFASRIEREGETPAATSATAQAPPPGAMMPAHALRPGSGRPEQSREGGQMTGPPAAEPLTTKIPPAEGGVTIADLWARRAALAGKTVTVRGKVVKFNGGILDRNWIHIQDGSGDPKNGTHDLTITTQGVAKVGDIITATGTLALNKDIGSGYKYGAIVEGATIVMK